MRGVLLVALLLAACDDQNKQQTDSTQLAMESGEHAAEIQQLQDRLDKLENQQQVTSLDEASTQSQVESLRNTFNNDVDLDNKRAHATYNLIQDVDRRLSRYDGQRSTAD